MLSSFRIAKNLVWVLLASSFFTFSTSTQSIGVGTVTITGTLGYYDSATSTVIPMAAKHIYVGSSGTSTNLNLYTDNQGHYSFTIPAGSDYSMQVESVQLVTDPLPSFIRIFLSNLDFSADKTMNITLPAAHRLRVLIKDSAGNPLPGAKLHLNGGTTYGTDTRASLSPYTDTATQNINFSTGYGGPAFNYTADANGYATLYTFNFINPIKGYIDYTVPAGFKVYDEFTYTPDRSQEFTRSLTIPTTVRISGNLAWTDSQSVTHPIANEVITFGGGGTSQEARTDSSGYYSTEVPAGIGYSATVEWVTSGTGRNCGTPCFTDTSIEQPAQAIVYLRNLSFDTNTVLNVTLPKAKKVTVTVKDNSNNLLPGAKVYMSAGAWYGTSDVPIISGYSGQYQSSMNFASGFRDQSKIHTTGSDGTTNLWSYTFSNSIESTVKYQRDSYTVQSQFSFKPMQDTSTVVIVNLPTPKVLSGRVQYTDTNSALVPVANKVISISGNGGVSTTATTDANGNYSATIPSGTGYSLYLEWMPALNAPLPPYITTILQGIDLTESQTLNITYPKARVITTTVTDAAGNPVRGAATNIGTSASYGTSSELGVSGYVGSLVKILNFSSGYNGYNRDWATNSQGISKMYTFDFANSINTNVTYKTSSGFSTYKPISFTPTTDLTLSAQFTNFAVATSLGNNSGDLSIFSSNGTTLADVSLVPSTANTLPDGVIDLTGVLTYTVKNLALGQVVTMTFVLPDGISPTNIFKVIDGKLVDLSSIATFESQTVTMLIKDGGDGDDDGEVNGEIVDPLTFVNASASTAISTLSRFTVNGSNVITPGSAINVAPGTTSVDVVATPTSNGATRTISGNTNLVTGANTLSVRVTSANGANVATYTTVVNVLAAGSPPPSPAPFFPSPGGAISMPTPAPVETSTPETKPAPVQAPTPAPIDTSTATQPPAPTPQPSQTPAPAPTTQPAIVSSLPKQNIPVNALVSTVPGTVKPSTVLQFAKSKDLSTTLAKNSTFALTLPNVQKATTIKQVLITPNGKSYTLVSGTTTKAGQVSSPTLKFAKPGTYSIKITTGTTTKTVKIIVK